MRLLLAVLLVVAIARGAGAAESAGFGAYPLTSTCAAAWFIDHVDASGKRLHLMAYVTGRPGWIRKDANFRTAGDTISFSCGGVPVRFVLEAARARANVQGQEFPLAHDNVFLVTAQGGAATVRAMGRHKLVFAEEENAATELLAREGALREALTGRPTPRPVPTPNASSPQALALLAAGKESYRNSDLERACDAFKQAAELGLPEAEYAYGYCLQSGQGRATDLAAANAWYEKAAAHGNRNAMFKLGWSAREGRGMPKDATAALAWFRKCAAAGDSICQGLVGDMFERGEGTPAQFDSALAWYGLAADRGVADAQYRIARAAADGKVDPSIGLFWLSVLEAQPGLPPDLEVELSRWRAQLEPRLTATQRAGAGKQAEAWLVEDSIRTLEALAR